MPPRITRYSTFPFRDKTYKPCLLHRLDKEVHDLMLV